MYILNAQPASKRAKMRSRRFALWGVSRSCRSTVLRRKNQNQGRATTTKKRMMIPMLLQLRSWRISPLKRGGTAAILT
jgi:hypothetical protein